MGKLLALKTAAPNRAALIDEFGDIVRQRLAFAPTEARYKQLTEELKTWFAGSPVDKEVTEKGTRYQLVASACAKETTVNIRAAYKRLGLGKFLKLCSITLKALAEELSAPEIAEVTTSAQTGSRRFVATPLGQPADVAAQRGQALPEAA